MTLELCDRYRNNRIFKREPSGLSLRMEQTYDLPGFKNSPGEDGMHTKGSEDPQKRAVQLEKSVGGGHGILETS